MGYEVIAGALFAGYMFFLSIYENQGEDPDGKKLRFNKRWRKLLFYTGWIQIIFTLGTSAISNPELMIMSNLFMYVIFLSFVLIFNLIGWFYSLFERIKSR